MIIALQGAWNVEVGSASVEAKKKERKRKTGMLLGLFKPLSAYNTLAERVLFIRL